MSLFLFDRCDDHAHVSAVQNRSLVDRTEFCASVAKLCHYFFTHCHVTHLTALEFKNDLDFAIEGEPELVKLARTYHDELVKINVKGEIMTELSSCTLYPNTFKVKMKDIYYALLNDVLESAGGKAYARGVKNE